ncbi:unnamed protein product, partial [Effrenium voratum]
CCAATASPGRPAAVAEDRGPLSGSSSCSASVSRRPNGGRGGSLLPSGRPGEGHQAPSRALPGGGRYRPRAGASGALRDRRGFGGGRPDLSAPRRWPRLGVSAESDRAGDLPRADKGRG